jgi:hypothetical protein
MVKFTLAATTFLVMNSNLVSALLNKNTGEESSQKLM